MPSASTFAHLALSNLGPLTTTYTAPASCATGTARVNIAFLTTPHALFEFSPDCTGQPIGDCVPSGAVMDSAASVALTTPAANTVFYYSPGLVCPSNWATMGAVARASDGKFSSSGAFTATTPAPTRFFDPPMNVLMNAIDPGETAVVCCPSNWEVNGGGVCFSTLPSSVYKPSVGCQRLLEDRDILTINTTTVLFGSTISAEVGVIVGTTSITPSTTTFAASETSSYVGLTIVPVALLVHKAGETGKPNAAASLRTGGSGPFSTWSAVVCAVSAMVAGAIITAPLY